MEGRFVEEDVLYPWTFCIYGRFVERTFCQEGRYVEGRFVDERFVEGRFVEGRFVVVPFFYCLSKLDRLSRLKAGEFLLIPALRIPRVSLHGFHKSGTKDAFHISVFHLF